MRRPLILSILGLILAATVVFAQAAKPISTPDRARIDTTRTEMRKLADDINAYNASTKAYPAALDDLVKGNVRETIPKDGWGNAFTYRAAAGGFELISRGADGKVGGDGADADITWNENGEVRELTADEKAELAKRREEQAFWGCKVLAMAEMRVAAKLLIAHRRSGKDWPKNLADIAPKDDAAQKRCFDDPWGHAYEYKTLAKENFAVVCYGADGKEGGSERAGDFVISENDVRIEMESGRQTDSWFDESARDARAVNDLADGVRQFKRDQKRLPADLDELRQRKVRQNIPRDKFGNEYIYISFGADEFYVIHLGHDNLPGGISDAADAISPRPGSNSEGFGEARVPELNALLAKNARQQLEAIAKTVSAYNETNKKYPDKLDDLELKDNSATDPWGNKFEYEQVKDAEGKVSGCRIICRGADGRAGGIGHDADFAVDEKGKSTVMSTEEKD
ncbi:MAG: type II secretion system protein GspG [Planctomycetes bacterium]|nr:type II secretion system protein GspG [Planctomycetota bacterium]